MTRTAPDEPMENPRVRDLELTVLDYLTDYGPDAYEHLRDLAVDYATTRRWIPEGTP